MKSIRAAALPASLCLLACGGGTVGVPENYRPPANPIFSPTAPAPAARQERPPPPPAPEALVVLAPPPAGQAQGGSAKGFDQLGTEGPQERGGETIPPPATPRGERAPEAPPEGGR